MENNILKEPLLIQSIYNEYCSEIIEYQNFNRPSIFIKYLNINKQKSIVDTQLNSSVDKFTTNGIVYDIYEYTPLYYIASIINDSTNNSELIGQMFQESSSVTVYTIDTPNINDIIVICYPPINKYIYMKVTNIRASINAMNNIKMAQLNWFDLTLERAPILNLNNLQFHNHFAYLLTEEKNIKYNDYIKLLKHISYLEKCFNNLKILFDNRLELYTTNNYISIKQNKILFNYLTKSKNYKRYFENVLRPYNVYLFKNTNYIDLQGNPIQENIVRPNIFVNELIEYNYSIDLYNMNQLLRLFKLFIDSI